MLSAGFLDRFTPLQCDSLLLGGLLALWLRGPHRDLARLARWGLALSLVEFFLLQAGSLVHNHSLYIVNIHGRAFGTLGFSGVNIFSASILLLAIDAKTWVFRILQNSTLRWLGKISYGFYVFHDIPHIAYERLTQTLVGPHGDPFGLLTGAFALIGTLLLSWLSFRYFESKFLRLKRHFTVPRSA
jgi:peptidoglycan/LPS O-acetylase OafA/YrhL